jgi:hypothetical protein
VKRAVLARRHFAQVVVIADAGEHDLRTGRRFLRRRRSTAAMLFHPGIRLCGGAVIDGDVVPGSGEMSGHRISHHAEPDEGDFAHGLSSRFDGPI